jgi:hypothetical protein
MDPTVVAAAAGVIGAVIGAVLAEMVAGFMELVALQIEDQPAHIKPRWKAYLCDQYNSSAVLREHISTCIAWYADDLLHILPTESAEVSASRISDKPNA